MKTGNLFCVLSLIFYLSGCASSSYPVNYNTEPKGASVICNGNNMGYSPVTLNYLPDENNKKTGSMKTVPCMAIWSSGVKKEFSSTWDLNKFPSGVINTLQRQSGEGYTQDVEFALKVQLMKNKQAQADTDTNAGSNSSLNEAARIWGGILGRKL